MPLRSSGGVRAPFGRSASKAIARPDNRLAFFDQATFLSLRATGREQLMQIVWIYEHAVDFDRLRRTYRNGGYGLLGRRIERSPLPFGRHRWVSAVGQPLGIDIAECARPRAEVSDWADERAQLPIDPEWGPGWHAGSPSAYGRFDCRQRGDFALSGRRHRGHDIDLQRGHGQRSRSWLPATTFAHSTARRGFRLP